MRRLKIGKSIRHVYRTEVSKRDRDYYELEKRFKIRENSIKEEELDNVAKNNEDKIVPFTKYGIWQYIVNTDFSNSGVSGSPFKSPLVRNESDLREVFIIMDGHFVCEDFDMNRYMPFVSLVEEEKTAYVGYTSCRDGEGVMYTIWKLKWENSIVIERNVEYEEMLVTFV